MTSDFPIVVCVVGAVVDFLVWAWLGKFRLRKNPPASLARLSIEQRQRRVAIARWIIFASGWVFIAGAILLAWIEHSRVIARPLL